MIMDNGDYKLTDVVFGAAERRLVRRYCRMLQGVADGRWVAPERLYFAAASAVECLRNGRDDAALLRLAGASPEEVAEGRAVARDDAQFYIGMALGWIERSYLRAA